MFLIKTWKVIKTIVLTSGALVNDIGSKLLAVIKLFECLGINSLTGLLISEIAAISSWRLVSQSNSNGKGNLLQEIKKGSSDLVFMGKLAAGGILLVGSIGGFIAIGLMSYYSSDVFYRYIGIENRTTLSILNALNAFSAP